MDFRKSKNGSGKPDGMLHVLYSNNKGRAGIGKYIACLAADALIGVLQYSILLETFELLGIEFSMSLVDVPLIGWLFVGAPDLSAQHLFAMMSSVLFVGVPIFAWIIVMEPSVLRIPKKAERIGRVLSIGVFAMIMMADFLAIWFRATYSAGGFFPKSDIEIVLSFFFGLLAAALMVMATFMTAVVHITRADKPSQE